MAKKDTSDFREHLSNVNQRTGKRTWIYPKIIAGRFYRYRSWFSAALLLLLFIGPWLRWKGHPLFLFDVLERKFIIAGIPFFPQDFYLLALGLLSFIVFIMLFTSIFGRLFCGWICPQTVFMEMVFRRIENWIEGNASAQKKLDEGPLNLRKILKKTAKHTLFWLISFLIANTFLAYLIGSDALLKIITEPIALHTGGFVSILVFTTVFYLVFAKLRELVCIMICPYGRLQGVLLDQNSVVVAYDHQRGEPRGHLIKGETAAGKGDCVDCGLCVEVCPTGIDIRNGTQLECVACTACMDACDSVMHKINKPPGLIRYASENQIVARNGFTYSSRMKAYTAFFVVLFGVFATLLALRKDLQASVLRTPGTTFVRQQDGTVANFFLLKLTNKTFHNMKVQVSLDGIPARIQLLSDHIDIKGGEHLSLPVIVHMKQSDIKENTMPFQVLVSAENKEMNRVKLFFNGPVFD
jgi:cytochrome c oxidase accessory protein FixG